MALPWKKAGLGCLAAVVLLVVVAVSATVGFTVLFFGPRQRPLTDRRFEATPERLERGRYLVEARYGCFGCHSERDWKQRGAPAVAGQEGAGANWADHDMPWLTAPNITPDRETGIGNWSDDAVARAIREGIGNDGRALFPMMPYESYRRLPDEDVAAIVAYLKSRPPVKKEHPPTRMPMPMGLFIQAVPRPLEGPVPPPDVSTPEKRGEFLVNTADCAGCHTPKVRGTALPGMDFGGGFELPNPAGKVVSVNITMDPSGIPYYDEALFIQAMREGRVGAREIHPAMPWVFFGKWTDEDLKAAFAYLKTVPRVAHQASNHEPPTDCPVCGTRHGLGDRNVKRE